MRQINEARRQRALWLSERLEEIAGARLKLLAELDDLDAQARAVLLERNILHNLDAPTSDIPAELLAMIFEAHEDMHLSQGLEPHFGALVSHVSHHWREIALSTPTLWSRVRFVAGKRKSLEQFYLYLSRSQLAPVDIYLDLRHLRLVQDPDQDLLQSVANHMGHCRQLCIENVKRECLQRFLKCTSHQPAPILAFLKIGAFLDMYLEPYLFSGPPFASASPRLRILHIRALELNKIQIPDLSVFKAVTHLRLETISISNSESYSSFRCILGEMKLLSHLELQPLKFPIPLTPQSPLELPNLLFLHVYFSDCHKGLNFIIQNIRASSLAFLSLEGWYDEEEGPDQDSLRLARSHFPSLRHLTLYGAGDISAPLSIFHALAEAFPDVERLTCGAETFAEGQDIQAILDAINNCTTLAWPKLESIAVSRTCSHFPDLALRNAVFNLQQAGRPLHMLLLPQDYISETNTEALAQLREVVEIEPFNDDWPTPFETGF